MMHEGRERAFRTALPSRYRQVITCHGRFCFFKGIDAVAFEGGLYGDENDFGIVGIALGQVL